MQHLKEYLRLLHEDKWDSEEAIILRKELDAWSRGNESELIKADMDIRMRQFRRSKGGL